MNKSILNRIIIVGAFLLFSFTAFTQPPPPGQHGGDGDQPLPIGSGLVILLAMGAAYGAKKVYDARKGLQK